MGVFLIAFFLVFVGLILQEQGIKKIYIKFYASFIGLYLIFLAVFRRWNVGGDVSHAYVYMYHDITEVDWSGIFDIHYKDFTFWYLTKAIDVFFDDYEIFVSICALLAFPLVMRFINRYSKNVFLSYAYLIGFGFYAFGLSGVRQWLAMAVVMLSITWILERKPWRFFLNVLFASTIHITAVCFFPAYILARIKPTPKNMLIYLVLGVSSLYLGQFVIQFGLQYLFAGAYGIEAFGMHDGGRTTIVGLIVIIIMILSRIRNINQLGESGVMYLNFLMVALLIQMQVFIIPLVSRVALYYMFYLVMAIPEFVASYQLKSYRMIGEVVLFAIALTAYLAKFYDIWMVYPYYFFWE